MPYTPSSGSTAMIQRLRDLLSGGGQTTTDQLLGQGGTPSPDLLGLIKPTATAPQGNFWEQMVGNMGNSLVNGANAIQSDPTQQGTQNFLEQYLQSMAGDINGGAGLNAADYEQALKNSAAQIKKAYGAEIGAVRASSANARHQTKRSKQQIRRMYNALSRQYDKAAGNEVAQGQQIAQAIQNVTSGATGAVKSSSDQLLNEQAALAQGLGVQAALPTVTADQASAVAKQIGNIQETGNRNATDTLTRSGNQQRFLVRGGKNALLEGTNKRADLVQQLQAFLQQNMGKIADIQGQQGQALAANASSAAKSFSDAASQASNEKWNREKELASLLISLQGKNGSKTGTTDSVLPKFAQNSSALLSKTFDPQGIGNVIQGLLSDPRVTTGQIDLGHGQTGKMTPAMFADLVAKKLQAQGVNPEDIAIAKLAALQDYQGYH